MEAAGLDAEGFSGHTLRATMITSATLAGADKRHIKQAARHTSNVTERYIREAEQRTSEVPGKIDVGS